MDTLEFIVELAKALAWPIAISLIVWRFRVAIGKLLSGDVKRWKAGPSGVEFEYWEQRVQEIRGDLPAGESAPREALEGVVASEVEDELQQLAAASPRAAVMEAYARIEEVLKARLESVGGIIPPSLTGLMLAQTALEKGIISAETVNAFEGLRVLRNLAAHGREEELTARRALEFVSLAAAVIYSIQTGRRTR